MREEENRVNCVSLVRKLSVRVFCWWKRRGRKEEEEERKKRKELMRSEYIATRGLRAC